MSIDWSKAGKVALVTLCLFGVVIGFIALVIGIVVAIHFIYTTVWAAMVVCALAVIATFASWAYTIVNNAHKDDKPIWQYVKSRW